MVRPRVSRPVAAWPRRANVSGRVFTGGMEGNEAPGESGDEAVDPAVGPSVAADAAGEAVEPSLSGRIADTCSAMLDAVAVIDRIEARQDAWKIEFIDQARRIAESTGHGLVPVGSTLNEQQQREMVRRSFVAEVAGVLRIPESTAGRLIGQCGVDAPPAGDARCAA